MGIRGIGARPLKFRPPPPVPATITTHPTPRTRAERLINWINGLTVASGFLAGQPFKLRAWQVDLINEVYATDDYGKRTVRQVLLTMGRKNGKSSLSAALALAHLCGPESIRGGLVLSGAADRMQAAIIYKMMKDFALAQPDLADHLIFRDVRKEIEDVETNSIYQALSSDARKAHGMSPSFYIADEVAQWRGRDLLEALRTGSGAHSEPLGFVISTRSPDPLNPLEELIKYAGEIESGLTVDTTYRAFIYSAPIEADPWDPETWKIANPALDDFRSLEDVRMQAEQAKRIPSLEAGFRAYILNQPISVDTRWISGIDWDACNAMPEPSGPCYGGLDLAAGPSDLSAFSLYWPETQALKVWAFIPSDLLADKSHSDFAPYGIWKEAGHVIAVPGRTIDRAWLGNWIATTTEGLELEAIASDRWLLDDLKAQIEKEGLSLPFEGHGAGYKDVSPSLRAFEALIMDRTLRHGGNPLLRWSVANAAIETDPAGNRKLSKKIARGRIDPLVASVYAVGIASRRPAPADYSFTGMTIAA